MIRCLLFQSEICVPQYGHLINIPIGTEQRSLFEELHVRWLQLKNSIFHLNNNVWKLRKIESITILGSGPLSEIWPILPLHGAQSFLPLAAVQRSRPRQFIIFHSIPRSSVCRRVLFSWNFDRCIPQMPNTSTATSAAESWFFRSRHSFARPRGREAFTSKPMDGDSVTHTLSPNHVGSSPFDFRMRLSYDHRGKLEMLWCPRRLWKADAALRA